jgi:hypothetical protein
MRFETLRSFTIHLRIGEGRISLGVVLLVAVLAIQLIGAHIHDVL